MRFLYTLTIKHFLESKSSQFHSPLSMEGKNISNTIINFNLHLMTKEFQEGNSEILLQSTIPV